MIKNIVYIPYLGQSTTVTADSIQDLQEQIKTTRELLQSLPEQCGWRHVAEGLLQAYRETLDTLREV